ncbi:MAG TPA: hypothetical protein VHE37_08375 [Nevskiaceae bacterium]|nr:hypothetical protein [Nevskiaceae bacterium]
MNKIIAVAVLALSSAPSFAAGPLQPVAAVINAPAARIGGLAPATVALPPVTIATPGIGKGWSKSVAVPLPGLGALDVSDTNQGRGGSHTLKLQVVPD